MRNGIQQIEKIERLMWLYTNAFQNIKIFNAFCEIYLN